MRTGKELFNTLLVELNEMGLPGMSATLDEMYRSPKFLELDPLTAIANLVEPEYQKKINKRILSRLRSAHLRGCPQELSSCVDSGEREYLPRGITGTLSTLDFIDSGLNVCILGPSDSGKSYLAKANQLQKISIQPLLPILKVNNLDIKNATHARFDFPEEKACTLHVSASITLDSYEPHINVFMPHNTVPSQQFHTESVWSILPLF